MKKIFIALSILLLSACATLTQTSPVTMGFTYATMKQIEKGNWTAAHVLEEVARIRTISNTTAEIDINDIVKSVLDRAGIVKASDRFLVAQFLGALQDYVVRVEAKEEQSQRLSVVLDAVEQGAMLSQ